MPQFIFRLCPWTRNFTKLIVFNENSFEKGEARPTPQLGLTDHHGMLQIYGPIHIYPDIFFLHVSRFFYILKWIFLQHISSKDLYKPCINRWTDVSIYSLLMCTLRMCMSQLMATNFHISNGLPRFALQGSAQ